jgi:hypothetical protein
MSYYQASKESFVLSKGWRNIGPGRAQVVNDCLPR